MGHQGFESREKTRKKNQQRHKEKGLCIFCSKKAEKGKTLCAYHLKCHKDQNKKYREKKNNGK